MFHLQTTFPNSNWKDDYNQNKKVLDLTCVQILIFLELQFFYSKRESTVGLFRPLGFSQLLCCLQL